MARSTPGTDTIEDDIRATRRSIDDKVERIQRRLSPGEMVDTVVDFARTNGGAIAGTIGRGVRDNPVPVAMITAGVIWLALSSRGGDYEESAADVVNDGPSTGEKLRQRADDLRHKAAGMGDDMRERARRVGRQAGTMSRQTRDQALRAGRSGGRFVKDHPILVGAAGVALGAALAAALPRTAREDRTFGERADATRETARRAAAQEGRKVQEAAKEAVAKAREAAERRAPTGEDLKRDAEQTAKAATEPKNAPGSAG